MCGGSLQGHLLGETPPSLEVSPHCRWPGPGTAPVRSAAGGIAAFCLWDACFVDQRPL